jgi:Protein of unknown function (DUF3843)
MSKQQFRPEGFEGSVEEYLPEIQNSLTRTLARAQQDLTHDTLKLARPYLKTLAAILVEFAEDLHCGMGIWHSLERYNLEFFGTPLPFDAEAGAILPPGEISPARVRHLLRVLYAQMIPDLLIAPEHVDLLRVADVASDVLRGQFADLPRDSGIQQFLGTPDDHGWEVKRKLIWLGTRSYLLRVPFERYVEEQDAKVSRIAVIDDFLCQQNTEWSGLGALEVLASVLDLPPGRRTDLLSWSERHNAVYKVLSGNKDRIEVLNLINDRKYRVRMNLGRNPFPRGSLVQGSLVPWDGEWFWSGEQKTFKGLDAATIARLKSEYRKLPSIYYRYSPEDLKKARGLVRQQYDEFVARHGKDWVAYPDGLAMAADWQKEAKQKIAALPPAERKKLMERHGLETPSPRMDLPPDLLESKDGIGVYFNPEEGIEIAEDFDALLAGLRKRGVDLTPDEEGVIRGWILSESISPGFVRRLAGECGDESIRAAFLLGKHDEGYLLEYLLRRYKGRFYRPRYPTLTLVG